LLAQEDSRVSKPPQDKRVGSLTLIPLLPLLQTVVLAVKI
jgi:hypothetical protein